MKYQNQPQPGMLIRGLLSEMRASSVAVVIAVDPSSPGDMDLTVACEFVKGTVPQSSQKQTEVRWPWQSDHAWRLVLEPEEKKGFTGELTRWYKLRDDGIFIGYDKALDPSYASEVHFTVENGKIAGVRLADAPKAEPKTRFYISVDGFAGDIAYVTVIGDEVKICSKSGEAIDPTIWYLPYVEYQVKQGQWKEITEREAKALVKAVEPVEPVKAAEVEERAWQGQIWEHRDGDQYIVAFLGPAQYCLIDMELGNRFKDPSPMNEVFGKSRKCFTLVKDFTP